MEIGEKTIQATQRNIDALLEFGRKEMNRVFQRDRALTVALKVKFSPGEGESVRGRASIKFTTDEFDHDTEFSAMEKQGELFLVAESPPKPAVPAMVWFGMPQQWDVL